MNKKTAIAKLIKAGFNVKDGKINRADVEKVKAFLGAESPVSTASETFTVRFGVSGSQGDSGDAMYLRQDTLEELYRVLTLEGAVFEETDASDHWGETGEAGCTLELSGDKAGFLRALEKVAKKPGILDEYCTDISVDEEDGEISIVCEFGYTEDEDEYTEEDVTQAIKGLKSTREYLVPRLLKMGFKEEDSKGSGNLRSSTGKKYSLVNENGKEVALFLKNDADAALDPLAVFGVITLDGNWVSYPRQYTSSPKEDLEAILKLLKE